jgi:DNA (cytosine-5)-methyltransferase 1
MNFFSLFTGIGALDVGLERAGWEVGYQVEIKPFCQAVLGRHWPHVPKAEDIKTFDARPYRGLVRAVVGGFPCQGISIANTAHAGGLLGLDDPRSGLWREYARVIRELDPEWVVIENSSNLKNKGIEAVLGDLASLGFDAEWQVVSAGAVGASHLRKRAVIVAHRPFLSDANGPRLQGDECRVLAKQEQWRQYADAARSNRGCPSPRVCRGVDGIANRAHRIEAIGNAVDVGVFEYLARRINEVDGRCPMVPRAE